MQGGGLVPWPGKTPILDEHERQTMSFGKTPILDEHERQTMSLLRWLLVLVSALTVVVTSVARLAAQENRYGTCSGALRSFLPQESQVKGAVGRGTLILCKRRFASYPRTFRREGWWSFPP